MVCPYCGESTEIAVDPGGGGRQEYVEDCPVCCRPWTVRVRYDDAGRVIVDLEPAA
ncbi:MAG: CPXCG motif-containing cysteine-rich protein [Gemmatimonadota bacterium]